MSTPRTVDKKAELAVIASILAQPERATDFHALRPDHFADRTHAVIFGAIQNLAGSHFDAQAIRAQLAATNDLTDRVDEALKAAFGAAGKGGNPLAAADLVRNLAVRRSLRAALDDIASILDEPGLPTDDLRDKAEAAFFAATEKTQPQGGPRHIREHTHAAIEDLAKSMRGELLGITTGIPKLDEATQGLQPGWLVCIGGRTSHGKSALGVQTFAWHVATCQAGGTSIVFSLEMRGAEIARRKVQAISGYTARSLRELARTGGLNEHVQRTVGEAAMQTAAARLYIDDQSGLSINAVAQRARRMKAQCPDLALVVIDNLQNFPTAGRKDKRESYDVVCRRSKELAKELNVPVMLLGQLRRELDYEDREPMNSDFRDTSAVETEADMTILIHRHGNPKDDPGQVFWPVSLVIGKGRSEGTNKVPAWFYPRKAEFTGVEDEDVWKARVDALAPKKSAKQAAAKGTVAADRRAGEG